MTVTTQTQRPVCPARKFEEELKTTKPWQLLRRRRLADRIDFWNRVEEVANGS